MGAHPQDNMSHFTLNSLIQSPGNLLVVRNTNGPVQVKVDPFLPAIKIEALVEGDDEEECRSVKLEVSSTPSSNTVTVKMPKDVRPSERMARGSTVINNFNQLGGFSAPGAVFNVRGDFVRGKTVINGVVQSPPNPPNGVRVSLSLWVPSVQNLDISSTNGDIVVQFPSGWRGEVEASTTNGNLHIPQHPAGEGYFRLSTVNGDIILRQV